MTETYYRCPFCDQRVLVVSYGDRPPATVPHPGIVFPMEMPECFVLPIPREGEPLGVEL